MRNRTPIIALFLVLATAGPALAHRVNVFAHLKDGRVVTESYFGDGTPCRECDIHVYDAAGKLLLSGTTDEKGGFTFEPPSVDILKIVLDAGRGHRAEYGLRLRGQAQPSRPPPAATEPTPGKGVVHLGRSIDTLSARVDGLAKEVGLLRQERKGVTVEKVLLGVAVLLALGAFVMVLRGRSTTKDRELPPGRA